MIKVLTKPNLGPVCAAILYGAIALTANTAAGTATAGELSADDRAVLTEMREGDLGKLIILDEPRERIVAGFVDFYGNRHEVADFSGKVLLVNFWATWCPPCRAEMPSINALQDALGGDDFEVVAISTDRGAEKAQGFFDEIGIDKLKLYHDRSRDVARQAGVLGLPVTLILDRDGREIARMHGDAEWDSQRAKALLRRIIEMTAAERV